MKIIRPVTVVDTGSFTRASSATYYDKTGTLQTATNDTPRFGYDPATLIPLGLIEEKAVTNLLLYSEQFDNGAWTKTNSSVSANSTVAPDGNTTADTVTATTATGSVSQSATVVNASTYIFSCFVKAGTSTLVRLQDSVSGVTGDFNLTAVTGTISTGTGQAKISKIGTNGWYRLRLHFTSTRTTATPTIINNNATAGATFYAWGAMLEACSALTSSTTSYIQTTSATATRAADVNTAGMLSNVAENDYTAYSSSTVYSTGTYVLYVASGIHKIYQSLTGSTSTVTMTIASPAVITWNAHGLAANTPIVFTTTGALPTGITAGTVYYVLSPTTNTFNISATAGGAAINTSGTQSGTHTATASMNYNQPVTNATYWLDCGNDNRWKMFDTSVQSQTNNTDAIMVAVKAGSPIDSVGLLNLVGKAIRVIVNDSTDGTVYDKTVSLESVLGVIDWYAYFFEPINPTTDVALTNLPRYGSATTNIIIYNTGSTVACGAAIMGLVASVGDTEFGAKVGIQDYSTKTQDTFGNYTIVKRAYNKRANYTVYIESKTVDFLQNILATHRATPLIYIGSDSYGAMIIYGYYKNFEIEIGYFDGQSICTIEIHGLT